MLKFVRGDILSADAEALVNTVNCVGIMGRGIALQFRTAFPENYRVYQAACRRGDVEPGRMFVFPTHNLTNPHYIINFPTKRHWRGKSRLEDIRSGLRALATEVERLNIHSIAIPPLGSGMGGLDWHQVKPLIVQALENFSDVEVTIYEPSGAPSVEKMVKSPNVPKMTPGRAALIGLLDRYLAGLLEPFVTLLEVHKLMYFMQEAGEGLRLNYVKAPYGPYSENLRQVLTRIEGYFISGYADGGDAPDKQIRIVPGAVADARQSLVRHSDTSRRFDRVVDLVDGFETPFGLELLSTVHWIAAREGAVTLEYVIAKAYAWNERKRRFSREQIELAWDVLHSKGWLNPRSGVVEDQ